MEKPAPAGRKTARARILEELRLFFTLFIYLWVLLGLFVLVENIYRREAGEGIVVQGFALLNALILGKVMLIAEHMDVARRLRHRPAIVPILIEALLCTGLFITFHIVERVVMNLFRGTAGEESVLSLGGGGYPGLILVAIILFVSLLPFFAFKNVTRIIGWPRMRHILFGRPDRTE